MRELELRIGEKIDFSFGRCSREPINSLLSTSCEDISGKIVSPASGRWRTLSYGPVRVSFQSRVARDWSRPAYVLAGLFVSWYTRLLKHEGYDSEESKTLIRSTQTEACAGFQHRARLGVRRKQVPWATAGEIVDMHSVLRSIMSHVRCDVFSKLSLPAQLPATRRHGRRSAQTAGLLARWPATGNVQT